MWGEPFFDHKEYSSRIIFSLPWLGGLNKLHNVSYRSAGTLVDSAAISNIQYGFLGVAREGYSLVTKNIPPALFPFSLHGKLCKNTDFM